MATKLVNGRRVEIDDDEVARLRASAPTVPLNANNPLQQALDRIAALEAAIEELRR